VRRLYFCAHIFLWGGAWWFDLRFGAVGFPGVTSGDWAPGGASSGAPDAVTPSAALGTMPLGSRPAKRRAGGVGRGRHVGEGAGTLIWSVGWFIDLQH